MLGARGRDRRVWQLVEELEHQGHDLDARGDAHRADVGTPPSASTGPGVGKPPVTIGDKNFTEEYILGALYAQALAAKGYKVTVKGNIGSSEMIYKAFQSGQIEGYPEYTGTLLTAIANITAPPTSAQAAYQEAKAYPEKHGFTMLNHTPFYDSDAIGTTKAYAAAHDLTDDRRPEEARQAREARRLARVRRRDAQGLVGLKKVYGINPTFVPLAIGLFYKALDSGQVNVSDVFTTDPQLRSGKYVVLADPKHEFGYQNAALIVKQSVLTAEGPAFAQTVNAVSALLTHQGDHRDERGGRARQAVAAAGRAPVPSGQRTAVASLT